MRELLEFLLRLSRSLQVASDLLGRRVGSHQFRMLLFKGFELLQEHVELIIAERRGVLDIVLPVGLVDDVAKLLYPYVCLCLFHSINNLQKY